MPYSKKTIGEKNYQAKLTESDAETILNRRLDGESCQKLADEYGVSRRAVRLIASGEQWKHVYEKVSLTRDMTVNKKWGNRRCSPLFSDEDADLRGWTWRLCQKGYPVCSVKPEGAGSVFIPQHIKAHRLVLERMLGHEIPQGMFCDHINGVPTDNRRCNLRMATPLQNSQNRQVVNKKGQYRGASLNKKTGRWVAQVRSGGVTHKLGEHETALEAAHVAAAKRRELGFPECGTELPPLPEKG